MSSLTSNEKLEGEGEGSSTERGFHLSRRRKSHQHNKSILDMSSNKEQHQQENGELHVLEAHFLPASASVLPLSLSLSSSSASVLPTNSSQQHHMHQQQQHPQQYQQEGLSPAVEEEEDEEEILISIDEAIERLGTGRFQWYILIASGLCFCGDAIQFVLLSFITMIIQQQWHLSNPFTASITSCIFAGASFGTLCLGPAADTIGRRPIFLLSAAMITIFGMGIAITQNYWTLIFMVFLVGFGVGGSIVPFDVLAEFLPATGRGKNLLLIEYFWTLGCLYVVVMAYMTLHNNGGDNDHATAAASWRTLVILCALPSLVALIVGYLFVPESARWLCTEGRTDQAMAILRNAATTNGHDATILFPSHVHLRLEEREKHASITDLFKPAWMEITLRLWGTWGAFAFGYYGTILAINKVFAEPESSNSQSSTAITGDSSYNFDYSAIFVSSAAELVGTTLVIMVVDRVGRIPSQVCCYLGGGLSVFLLCACAQAEAHRLLLISLGFAARVFAMGATCVTWVSTAEILTTEVRSTGHATSNAMARVGAFFCPFVVEGESSLMKIGIIMLLVNLWTVFCVYKLPETAGREMGAITPSTTTNAHRTLLSEQENETDDDDDDDEPTTEHSAALALIPYTTIS